MMGSAPTGGGGLSFEDVLGLFKDEPAYQAKLREMQKRTEEARSLHESAVEILRKAEQTKGMSSEAAAKAEQQVLEAKILKEAAERQAAEADKRQRALDALEAQMHKDNDEKRLGMEQHYQKAWADREAATVAGEKKLQADLEDYAAQKADFVALNEAFSTYKKGTEAKLAQREAALKQGDNELAVKMAEASAMKQELKSKLAKFKEVAAS